VKLERKVVKSGGNTSWQSGKPVGLQSEIKESKATSIIKFTSLMEGFVWLSCFEDGENVLIPIFKGNC